ncbi:hypothetical protein JXA32_05560 [Candidatus Sumerlaeota bacterium]|nr:hypothetical protein [Candidatus Sumerlaeota bacterium]
MGTVKNEIALTDLRRAKVERSILQHSILSTLKLDLFIVDEGAFEKSLHFIESFWLGVVFHAIPLSMQAIHLQIFSNFFSIHRAPEGFRDKTKNQLAFLFRVIFSNSKFVMGEYGLHLLENRNHNVF